VPDYRLAPEHPYPQAVEDAVAAFDYLAGGDRRIAVAGDSAGGGLALALAQRLRAAGGQQPVGIALLSPWTDLQLTGLSQTDLEDDPLANAAALHGAAAMYASGTDLSHPEVSPLHADLRGLAPMHVEVGTGELLLPDSLRLAEAARSAGVPLDLHVAEGLPHVFQVFATTPEAVASTDRVGAFLRRCLS
jgi:epsilon-lactone hydrolase